MQLVFDRVAKCDGCLHFDRKYKSDSPCGGCERNPKIKNLRDCYVKPKALVAEAKRGLPPAPTDDATREVEAANDAEMSEWGINPAASRRAMREPESPTG